MKKYYFTPSLLIIAGLLGACNTMPGTTRLLDQTRSDFQVAQSNPKVAMYAPMEMKQATDAMRMANTAANENESAENINHLAYLAKQKIALTEEVAKRKSAETEVENAARERDQMRLEQRTNEADRAKVATRAAEAYSAKLKAQLADLSAKMTERGLVITLNDVLFQTDRAQLTQDGWRRVQKLAEILQQNPQRRVLIEGYTDSTGSTAHNQKLSEQRAFSVRRSLQEMGVRRERIATHGFGEAYPVASNETSEDRQLNRRVEILLSDEQGVIRSR